jgi:hypothetical protein
MGADAYISLHYNLAGTTGGTTASGTTTYIWGENDYYAANAAVVPDGTYNYAQLIHMSIINSIRDRYDVNWPNRGFLQANFGELRIIKSVWVENPSINIPAALFDIAYLDNLTIDNVYCHDSAFKSVVSRGIVTGLIDYFAQKDGISASYPPLGVSNLTIQTNDSIITLSWAAIQDTIHSGGAIPDYYFIYTSNDGIVFSADPISTRNSSYTFNADDVDYRYFKVSAYNQSGESILSDTVYAEID